MCYYFYMKRLILFKKTLEHPYYKRIATRLTKEDHSICLDFIAKNGHLNANQWAFKVNRMFLDELKPRNVNLITDLLTAIK